MHELSICESILSLAVNTATQAGAGKITRIRVKHGELRAIVPDLMNHYFQYLARDTIAAEAELEMEIVPARARCKSCGEEYQLEGFNFQCPSCKEQDPEILQGMELFMEDIEVQD